MTPCLSLHPRKPCAQGWHSWLPDQGNDSETDAPKVAEPRFSGACTGVIDNWSTVSATP